MLYGSPAFIQDGVLPALESDLPEVAELREAYRRRAGLLSKLLADAPNCRATLPEGGMFVLLDVRGTGLGSEDFARELLIHERSLSCPATALARVPQDTFASH
jgi:arginine:pyruvate transaminase